MINLNSEGVEEIEKEKPMDGSLFDGKPNFKDIYDKIIKIFILF